MTIEQTTNNKHAFYVNMDFSKLANDINNSTLQHSFNGKGRKVTYLEDNQEASYFYYSSDSAGKNKITPPFEISNSDTVTCSLQPWNNGDVDNSKAKFKWKDILQSRFDLQQVSKESKTEITYEAVASEGVTELDTVIINIHFKLNGDKFSVAWDPQIKIKK
ncbi:hypothetical protein EKO29_03520 [Colwellia sp. Arc7-635]|jgi:hypothetical protein|uniref:hypothetical protein n=1 Tax=Colwellia sp. Arc7-635 TaxID=2497879 RepID=UPI000F8552CD|nr:hypothetical protein [Colwellia sp. Arc7-635]AZQ83207.1 hypothetical protein EKO29_03520 [Colwellia sp. Arc7-635]